MTIPNYITNGAYTKTFEATLTNVLVVAPASISAGNRLVLVSGTRSTSTSFAATYNPPAGWTNLASISRNTAAELRIWTKIADGTESSITHTIVVNGGPGAALTAVMWMFDANAAVIESINTRSGGSTTVSAVDIVTSGPDRLCVDIFFTQNISTLTTTLGGTTGGSWVRTNQSDPAQNAHLLLYTCPLAAQANLTSGSAIGAGASNWFSWGAAFYQPVDMSMTLTTTGLSSLFLYGDALAAIPFGIPCTEAIGGPFLVTTSKFEVPGIEVNFSVGSFPIVVPVAYDQQAVYGHNDTFIAYSYNTDETALWNFAQYGNNVFATNHNDPIQVYSLGAITTFSNLGGGSPRAKCIAPVKNFLVAANTIDELGKFPQRVQWSAIDNPFSWTVDSTTQADFQDLFGDGGANQSIAIGLTQADAVIIQERAVWRMTYQGLPSVFTFDLLEGVRGTPAPSSVIVVGGVCYYRGEDGFYGFDGSQSLPIGQGRIDRMFQKDANVSLLHRMSAVADIVRKIIFWSYATADAVDGNPDRILVFNWATGEWSILNVSTEYLWRSQAHGFTLEEMDAFGDVDSIISSFDSHQWSGKRLQMSAFDTEHRTCHFSGPNMTAKVTTKEITISDPKRVFITEAWPVVDTLSSNQGISVAVGSRLRAHDSVSFAIATTINPVGYCPQRITNQYVRFQISISSSVVWDKVSGVNVKISDSRSR